MEREKEKTKMKLEEDKMKLNGVLITDVVEEKGSEVKIAMQG